MGPSKQLKQIIQIEHNIVKNPNWPEANQLAIYKRGRGFELGATMKQIQLVVRAGLEPGTAELRVRCADHSAMLPPQYCLSSILLIKLFLCCSLHSFVEKGVSGISELFQSLENLLIGQEPALHKKSLFGRFSVEKFRITLLEFCCLHQF